MLSPHYRVASFNVFLCVCIIYRIYDVSTVVASHIVFSELLSISYPFLYYILYTYFPSIPHHV